MNVFQCEDGTILNMDKFCYISVFSKNETMDYDGVEDCNFFIRVEFGECCYTDLTFEKEKDRDMQYAKILHHLTGDNPIKKNCR